MLNEIFIRADPLKYPNLMNKAISSSICNFIIVWVMHQLSPPPNNTDLIQINIEKGKEMEKLIIVT